MVTYLAGNTFDRVESGRTHLHTPTTLDALGLIDLMDLPFGTDNGTDRTSFQAQQTCLAPVFLDAV
jgi:hypothetical protein